MLADFGPATPGDRDEFTKLLKAIAISNPSTWSIIGLVLGGFAGGWVGTKVPFNGYLCIAAGALIGVYLFSQ